MYTVVTPGQNTPARGVSRRANHKQTSTPIRDQSLRVEFSTEISSLLTASTKTNGSRSSRASTTVQTATPTPLTCQKGGNTCTWSVFQTWRPRRCRLLVSSRCRAFGLLIQDQVLTTHFQEKTTMTKMPAHQYTPRTVSPLFCTRTFPLAYDSRSRTRSNETPTYAEVAAIDWSISSSSSLLV